MKTNNSSELRKANAAITEYVDSLLHSPTADDAESAPLPVQEKIILVPELAFAAEIEQRPPQPTAPEHKPSDVIAAHQAQPVASPVTEQHDPVEIDKALEDYDFPLQCLMFNVAGVELSLPLIDLGHIGPWPEHLSHIPGAASWSRGVFRHLQHNIKIVDTSEVLGIRVPANAVKPAQVLVLADWNWALSCDRVGQVVKFEREDIQWSRATMGKGIKAGVIRQTLAQLLSGKKLVDYLNRAH